VALTVTQQTEILRILGFPNLGSQASLGLGYPAYASQFAQWQPYAWLMTRLNTMSSDEEVAIMGAESLLFAPYFTPASLTMTLSTPSTVAVGATLSIDVDGELITIAAVEGDTPATLVAKLASAILADSTASETFLINLSGTSLALVVRDLGTDGNGFPVMATSNDPSLLFVIAPNTTPAANGYGVTTGGANPPGPTIVPDGSVRPVFGYVPIIRILESDIGGARDNLDLQSVETYVPRPDEMESRARLLRRYRRELADRFNVPLDPDLVGNRRSGRLRRI
jgi:hypothetical protein